MSGILTACIRDGRRFKNKCRSTSRHKFFIVLIGGDRGGCTTENYSSVPIDKQAEVPCEWIYEGLLRVEVLKRGSNKEELS